jgi:hypothetical protein
MAKCVKCGTTLTEGANYCSLCGAAAISPDRIICSKCGTEIVAGAFFCDNCGAKVTATVVQNPSTPQPPPPINITNVPSPYPPYPVAANRVLRITRESQFQCMANTYQVIVNGNYLGNIGVGKTISLNVNVDTAVVDIICTTIMINARMRLVLKLGPVTSVNFKVEWPGDIYPTVYGAQVIEQTKFF